MKHHYTVTLCEVTIAWHCLKRDDVKTRWQGLETLTSLSRLLQVAQGMSSSGCVPDLVQAMELPSTMEW